MSIENHLAALTAAVIELTNAVKANGSGTVTVPQAPAPVAPVTQAPVTAQMRMPAPPVFTPPVFAAPVSAPTSPAAPFTDGAGLIAYVMAVYKEVGPQKGAGIQGVLTSLGVQNITDVRPDQYGALYAGVEALKRG